MAHKFDNGNIRLWVGENKNSTNIGIHIRKVIPEEESKSIYAVVKALLKLKYGGSY